MPDIISTTGTLKANLKYALEATGQLDRFAKNSATALKNGEALNLFENAVKDIRFFGKANVVRVFSISFAQLPLHLSLPVLS